MVKYALMILLIIPFGVTSNSNQFITLQSTTSTENSGLYDFLLPEFTAESGIKVRVVAVGTGQALRNARNGDGDILITHAREAEEQFVRSGFGLNRRDLMFNDFVIVGPPETLADSLRKLDPVAFLKSVAENERIFVSRGDDSGTHKKELELWSKADVDVVAASGLWYRETGTGMGATLNIAIGMGAFTLTDRGTWISFKNKSDFQIIVEGAEILHNQYGVVVATPKNQEPEKKQNAIVFCNWLLSEAGRAQINSFTINGEQLFYANGDGDTCD